MTKPALTAITHQWESSVASLLGQSAHAHVAHRCADLAELLGCAAAGQGEIAAISADLRGLDASVVAELGGQGLHILGVYRPGDEEARVQLARWGVEAVVSADTNLADLDDVLGLLLAGSHAGAWSPGAEAVHVPAQWSEEVAKPEDGEACDITGREEPSTQRGQVVMVWGPLGAPGRSTVALNLAAEFAAEHGGAMLIDADTYGASLAQMLGLLDEAPGLAAAVRAADQGVLDRTVLVDIAAHIKSGLSVITGMPRPDRWPEIRQHALADVLEKARECASWVVVDVAFCLEEDEELSFDTSAPRRNQATLTTLEAADQVVVVGGADPVGLQRLIRGLEDIKERSQVPRSVLINRVRPAAVGRDPERKMREVLQRFAGLEAMSFAPQDSHTCDAALLAGESLIVAAPKSAIRQSIAQLASEVAGAPLPQTRSRRLKS